MKLVKNTSNFIITKIEEVDPTFLSEFLENNDFKFNHFYPHDFSREHLVSLWGSKDYYAVGLLNGDIAAYGLLRGWEEGYSFPRLGIGVGDGYRGVGIGTFMCQYLHFVAKLRGCDFVQLRVHKDNPIAYAMYRKLGYDMREQDDNHWIGYYKCK